MTQNRALEANDKRKCNSLTYAEKIKILDWYHGHGNSQMKTATHFQTVFPSLNQTTISRLLKNESSLRVLADKSADSIRQREVLLFH